MIQIKTVETSESDRQKSAGKLSRENIKVLGKRKDILLRKTRGKRVEIFLRKREEIFLRKTGGSFAGIREEIFLKGKREKMAKPTG